MAKSKTPSKTPKKKQPEKRVPKHGAGMVYSGGVPGNKGGTGRPPSEIRKLFRSDLMETREILVRHMAATEKCEECGRNGIRDTDLIRLADFYAKYGIGTAKSGVDPDLVSDLARAVEEELPDIEGIDMDIVKEQIFGRWAITLGKVAAGDG